MDLVIGSAYVTRVRLDGSCFKLCLGKSRLLSWDITPFLDNRLFDLSGVGLGPGAHLLGHINTLLSGLQLGHQFGHMSTGSLRLQGALLLGGILDNSLSLVITDLSTLLEPTASRGTQLSGLLGTSSDGGVLLDLLLVDAAHLSGPLGALGEGGVTTGLIVTLLILDGFTLNHIILNLMFLLFGPALGFVLSSADFRSLNITVLDQRSSAHLDGLIEGNFLVVDEAVLSEVLLALLLLLGLVVGGVGGVTTPVVGVVTLDNLIILSFFYHLDLVNTSFTVSPRGSSSNSTKADIITSLTITTGNKIRSGSNAGRCCLLLSSFSIERESVEQRFLLTVVVASQLPGTQAAANQAN